MDQGNHGANAEMPFEAEPDIDQHQNHRQGYGHGANFNQFATDLGTDEFGAAIVQAIAKGGTHFCHRLLLGRGVASLFLDPDQYSVFGAKFLQRHFAQVQSAQIGAHVA